MLSKSIEISLIKFICNSANKRDLDNLNEWIQDEKYHSIFKEYVKTYFAITISMNELDKKEIKRKLIREIKKDKSVFYQKRIGVFVRYAAMVVFMFGIGIVLKNHDLTTSDTSTPLIVPQSDHITLQLHNGETKMLKIDENGSIQTADGSLVGIQNGSTLKYEASHKNEVVYNTLIVPNAKRFNLVLSDGTKVKLNSGSSLRYPISFLPGHKREIFLEGEAFLEVAHDKKNPFVVNLHDLSVEVLGTRFNLSDYKENGDMEVVLVDGSVSLKALNNSVKMDKVILEPGYMGSFNRSDKNISKSKVNTSLYTSWVEGRMVIRDESFENILIKLQRYYNVTIINNNASLAKERFNATIETKEETIEQILNYFKQVYQIDYKVVENKVVIN